MQDRARRQEGGEIQGQGKARRHLQPEARLQAKKGDHEDGRAPPKQNRVQGSGQGGARRFGQVRQPRSQNRRRGKGENRRQPGPKEDRRRPGPCRIQPLGHERNRRPRLRNIQSLP